MVPHSPPAPGDHVNGDRQFFHATDDEGLRTFKQQFLLAGALYHKLVPILGKQQTHDLCLRILSDIATSVQRTWYTPAGMERKWERFHAEHQHQMHHGLIRFNEHDEIVESEGVQRFHITRCCFFETFRDMGTPSLTEAFCRSDEVVFNEFSPELRFHRGEDPHNTIARGGPRCVFIFERVTAHRSFLIGTLHTFHTPVC